MPLFKFNLKDRDGDSVILTGNDARHLTRVLRVKIGEEVTLTDGDGHLFQSVLISDRPDAVLKINKKLPDAPKPFPIHLYLARLEADKIEEVLNKCVQLNVASVTLLETTRSEPGELSEGKKNRFLKIMDEAQKQSGRAFPMVLKGPVFFREEAVKVLSGISLFCWERGEREKIAEVLQKKISFPVSIWVGPKGGWTDEEVGLAKKMNFHLVEIAPLILRGELAALHAVSTALAFIK